MSMLETISVITLYFVGVAIISVIIAAIMKNFKTQGIGDSVVVAGIISALLTALIDVGWIIQFIILIVAFVEVGCITVFIFNHKI